MTIKETETLIVKIKTFFPGWNPKVKADTLIDNWHQALKSYDAGLVSKMLDRYLANDESGYAPSISLLIPKENKLYGFTGRTYTDEFFDELENEVKQEMLRGINERSEIIRK